MSNLPTDSNAFEKVSRQEGIKYTTQISEKTGDHFSKHFENCHGYGLHDQESCKLLETCRPFCGPMELWRYLLDKKNFQKVIPPNYKNSLVNLAKCSVNILSHPEAPCTIPWKDLRPGTMRCSTLHYHVNNHWCNRSSWTYMRVMLGLRDTWTTNCCWVAMPVKHSQSWHWWSWRTATFKDLWQADFIFNQAIYIECYHNMLFLYTVCAFLPCHIIWMF